jgi:hypothetical protein
VVGYFEKGTRPHFIHPVNALALHFKAGDGTDVFTKYVYHPGTVAWHMVELTKQDVQGKLNQYMQDTFDMVDKMMNAGGVTP